MPKTRTTSKEESEILERAMLKLNRPLSRKLLKRLREAKKDIRSGEGINLNSEEKVWRYLKQGKTHRNPTSTKDNPYRFSPELDKQLRELKNKDILMHRRVQCEILEMIAFPEPLDYLQSKCKYKKVSLGSCFLLFTIEGDMRKPIIEFLALEHPDKVYDR